jgi:AcrR family transcriptional regulator
MARSIKSRIRRDELVESCLAAFVQAGTLDLSLDALAKAARSTKRMLIHYFGSRKGLEEITISLLEERLRARFRASAFPRGVPVQSVIQILWDQVTQPASRGLLLLSMDLTRRGWSGSKRGRRFFEEQQRLWGEMLREFLPDETIEMFLQLFQGAALVYLATGDRERGRRTLDRFVGGILRTEANHRLHQPKRLRD